VEARNVESLTVVQIFQHLDPVQAALAANANRWLKTHRRVVCWRPSGHYRLRRSWALAAEAKTSEVERKQRASGARDPSRAMTLAEGRLGWIRP
jgi:hypothetical protein